MAGPKTSSEDLVRDMEEAEFSSSLEPTGKEILFWFVCLRFFCVWICLFETEFHDAMQKFYIVVE
jgi:hypothetical protein